jgi:hypothetical protein
MFRAAALLVAVLDVAILQPHDGAWAVDPATGFGPSVTPLARPVDSSLVPSSANGLNSYVPSPAYTPNFSPDQAGAPSATSDSRPANVAAVNSPAPSVVDTNGNGAPPRFAADQNRPLVASGPNTTQPATPNSTSGPQTSATAKTGHNPWQPIQAAFRQFTDNKSDGSSPAPAADVVPSRPNVNAPGLIDPGAPVRTAPRVQSVRASNMQPMPGDPTAGATMNSTPGAMAMPPAAALLQPGAAPPTPGPGVNPTLPTVVVYDGPKGPAAPGGCGCNGGGGCPDLPEGQAACPNCGGWKPCSTCTHDPEGSTILQRLACRLTRPRPDCSNGCVDFCDSWLFHENDWWATSNHKCPAEGCGPWPYGGCETDGKGKGNGCGCGNCGFCIPPPDFYFSAEAMALTRDNESRPQDVVLNTTLATTVLRTEDFSFDWRVGPSFILGYRSTPKDDWEFAYFGLQDFDSHIHVPGPAGDIALPVVLGSLMPPDSAFGAATVMDVVYTSLINNAEVNYYWYPGSQRLLSLMTGFRYFRLDERFEINATGGDPAVPTLVQSFYDIHSVNNLYGWQIGARWKQCGERFGYELTGKAGVYGNSVEDRQVVSNVSETPIRNIVAFQNNWAFIGQVDASVTYRISKGWQAIAGYNALWIDDVALAPDQLDFTNNPLSGTTIDHYGKVFMHGGHVGLAYRW